MRKKIAAFWLSLILLFSLLSILIEISQNVNSSTVLYVGGAGAGNFTKIQWAIENASNGDTIIVYNGTYYGEMIVDKTISLIGEDMETTIIDGEEIGDVIRITADWVNLTGFTMKHSAPMFGAAGIEIDSNYVTIFNITVVHTEFGIYIVSGTHNTIINCNISNHGYNGVYLDSASSNTITNNNISENWVGIRLEESPNNIITDNNINDTYLAIYIQESSNSNNITKNKILHNEDGIHIDSSNNNKISRNYILNNENGIYLSHQSVNNTINNNNISSNHFGINPEQDSWDNNIYNNSFENNFIQINIDSDGDGWIDENDLYPNDPNEWADTDGDSHPDNSDEFPNDPSEWNDTDGDGIGDNSDFDPNDPNEWVDTDGDGHPDNNDEFPNDPDEWNDADGDGIGDNSDLDDNNNYIPDFLEIPLVICLILIPLIILIIFNKRIRKNKIRSDSVSHLKTDEENHEEITHRNQ
jgi:parallel beta-helix repeat protein